jgi:hypothetical protein
MNTTERIGVEAAESALRRIAGLGAPEGLEERLEMRLRAAAQTREVHAPRWTGWSLGWQGWLRAAAAAAIVLAVAGGGWTIARQSEQAQAARQQPAPLAAPAETGGGFATGSARRTPQTLDGPTIDPAKIHAAQPALNPPARSGSPKKNRKARTGVAGAR